MIRKKKKVSENEKQKIADGEGGNLSRCLLKANKTREAIL